MSRTLRLLLPLAAVLSLAVALNLLALRYPARFDLTSAAVYSLSAQTQAVIAGLNQDVAIRFFYDTRSRAMLDARYLLQQYAAASARITVTSHDPALEPAIAQQYGVQFAGTTQFDSGGRSVTVQTPDETGFTNGLLQVTSTARGTVCFTDGHIESNPFSLQAHDHFEHGAGGEHGHDHGNGGRPLTLHERHGMGMARNALEVLGYTVEQRLLLQGPAMLEGCAAVVVASAQRPFQAVEIDQLERYLAGGGALLVMLEADVDSGLDDLLARRGLAASRARVLDPQHHYWTDPATPAVTDYPRHRLTRNLALTFFPGSRALGPSTTSPPLPWAVTPLVQASPAARLADDDNGDDSGASAAPLTLVLLAEAGAGGGRLIVTGDGDFATNSFFAALGNGQLFVNLVGALAASGEVIDIAPREYVLGNLRLDNRGLRTSFILTTIAGPLLILSVWVAVWWRRRSA